MASSLSTLPPSGRQLLVSETFVSVQGEGISTGMPAAFLRLGNCNLACRFCDTAYTWDASRYDLQRELTARSVDDLAGWILEEAPGRLIITGGEPLLQQKQLALLVGEVDRRTVSKRRLFIEVETNGTVAPSAALLTRVDQWNVSPKLKNSGERPERRFKRGALATFVAEDRAHFKFVVRDPGDVMEVDEWVAGCGLPWDRVSFMPEAASKGELRTRSPQVAEWALARRAHYSGRLHLELFDGRRGT